MMVFIGCPPPPELQWAWRLTRRFPDKSDVPNRPYHESLVDQAAIHDGLAHVDSRLSAAVVFRHVQ
jgi:hypothetical protein